MSAEQISDAKHMAQEICELLHGAPDEGCPHYASDVQDVEQYLLKRLTAHPDTGKEDGEDTRRLDWLEKWHLSLSRHTSPDMGGIRFSGQYFNPAKERGEAGPSYLRIQGSTIRAAIDAAQSAPNEGRKSP
jgi:hypothetical protein